MQARLKAGFLRKERRAYLRSLSIVVSREVG
jgi:hypothetical protein